MPAPYERRRRPFSGPTHPVARGHARARPADGRGTARAGRRGVLPGSRTGPPDRDAMARGQHAGGRGACSASAGAATPAGARAAARVCQPGSSWPMSPRRCTASAAGASTSVQDSDRPQPGGVEDAVAELKAAGLALKDVLKLLGAAVDRAGDAGASDGVHAPHDAAAPAAHRGVAARARQRHAGARTSGARCSSASAPRSAPIGRPRSIRANV